MESMKKGGMFAKGLCFFEFGLFLYICKSHLFAIIWTSAMTTRKSCLVSRPDAISHTFQHDLD